QIVEREAALADEALDVALEYDGDIVRESAVAMRTDAEPLANPAAMPVGCDQILRPHERFISGRQIADPRRDTLRVLLERDQLRRVAQLRAERFGMTTQDQLDPILAGHAGYRCAECAQVEVTAGARARTWQQSLKLPPGDRLCDMNGEVLERVPTCGDQVSLQSRDAQQLHAAHVHPAGTWVSQRAGMPFDEQRGYATPGKGYGCRQPRKPTADDENGDIASLHSASAPSRITLTEYPIWNILTRLIPVLFGPPEAVAPGSRAPRWSYACRAARSSSTSTRMFSV